MSDHFVPAPDAIKALCAAHLTAQYAIQEALPTFAHDEWRILSAWFDETAAVAILSLVALGTDPFRPLRTGTGKLTGIAGGLLESTRLALKADYATAIPHPTEPGMLAIRVQWSNGR